MTKYEKILENQEPCQHCTQALERDVNRVFSKQVAEILEAQGYKVQGIISLYQDIYLPNLWHVHDCTPEKSVALEFAFNVKTEVLRNKFEEVV